MESVMEVDEPKWEKDLNKPETILKKECEEMWAQLFEIYSKIQCRKESIPPKGIESDQEIAEVQRTILQAKEKKLQAELATLKNEKVHVPSKQLKPNEDFIKQKLVERVAQLEETLLVVRNQSQDIKFQLEREKEIFEQHQEIQKSIQQKITNLEIVKENQPNENSKIREVNRKTEQMEHSLSELVKKLGNFIKEHFPLPSHEEKHQSKQKMDVTKLASKIHISLLQLLEELIKQLYDSPHDPYIEIQTFHWPPYVELLLRCGIAQRHPQDCNWIRLEAFQS